MNYAKRSSACARCSRHGASQPAAACHRLFRPHRRIRQAPAFTIGGTVTGLTGTGLVLQDNGGDNLLAIASGPFVFPTAVTGGGSLCRHGADPADQSSAELLGHRWFRHGHGQRSLVTVTASPPRRMPRSALRVCGLTGSGLVLQDNGGDSLRLPPMVPTRLKPRNGAYARHRPDPTDRSQSALHRHQGLWHRHRQRDRHRGRLRQQLHHRRQHQRPGRHRPRSAGQQGATTSPTGNGAFTFKNQVPTGTAYAVTVLTQPRRPLKPASLHPGTGSGTATANVTSVVINCQAVTFSIGGRSSVSRARPPRPQAKSTCR